MGPVEALKKALEKEEAAMQFYQKQGSQHPEIRQLFTELYNEEYKHKKVIEEHIERLTRY